MASLFCAWLRQVGETALMAACKGGHADAARVLHERGADVEIKDQVCPKNEICLRGLFLLIKDSDLDKEKLGRNECVHLNPCLVPLNAGWSYGTCCRLEGRARRSDQVSDPERRRLRSHGPGEVAHARGRHA